MNFKFHPIRDIDGVNETNSRRKKERKTENGKEIVKVCVMDRKGKKKIHTDTLAQLYISAYVCINSQSS